MVKFDLGDCGTVMINAHESCHGDPFRTTGWGFTCKDGVGSFIEGETHTKTTADTHRVFFGAKLAPEVTSLKDILKQLDIIR